MKCPVYSGTPLLWTPWEPGKVSCKERCPYFRDVLEEYCIIIPGIRREYPVVLFWDLTVVFISVGGTVVVFFLDYRQLFAVIFSG